MRKKVTIELVVNANLLSDEEFENEALAKAYKDEFESSEPHIYESVNCTVVDLDVKTPTVKIKEQ